MTISKTKKEICDAGKKQSSVNRLKYIGNMSYLTTQISWKKKLHRKRNLLHQPHLISCKVMITKSKDTVIGPPFFYPSSSNYSSLDGAAHTKTNLGAAVFLHLHLNSWAITAAWFTGWNPNKHPVFLFFFRFLSENLPAECVNVGCFCIFSIKHLLFGKNLKKFHQLGLEK